MFSRIKVLKAISIILAVIFLVFFVYSAKRVDGTLFIAMVLGIVTLFILQAIALTKIEKELADEKVATAEEIRDLKKRLEELEK